MDIFESNTDTPADLVDQLVGEGKKFKSVADLAKGKVEADKTIEARERENAELREELSKRKTTEEFIARFDEYQAQRNTPNNAPEPGNKPAEAQAPVNDADLVNRIRQVNTEQREAEKTQANLETVKNELLRNFGTAEKAAEVVRQKAEELGVSVDFLQSAAGKSPKAFFAQLGLNSQAQQSPAPRSDVNTQALGNNTPGAKEGTYEWYRQIQRSTPALYFTPKIQNQMMKDAQRLGDAFYA